ncbi:apical endosomal glycoprotein-like [Dermacentor andersoni]|uniref:apical endosomal glycoprotein-like n=1 Tax=Dermacentor andersoni TaxID=34620 RepID=UPI0024172065|nr:apical endosomal glycoprotein-like [Dermacentor andersoni]
MTFFYTAQGTSLPEFSVSVRTSKIGPWKSVWRSVDPSQFFHFTPAHVQLMQPKPFQVAFIGNYRKPGNAGYIAIDDVTFSTTCTAYQGELPGAPTPSQPPQTVSSMPPSPPPTMSPTPPPPPPFACGDNEYQCGNSEQCISLTKVCDFKDDCSNSADEANCGACEITRDLCGLENENPNARFGWTWKAAQDAIHNHNFPVTDSRDNEHGSYATYSLLNSDVPVGSGRNSMITPRLGPIAHSCVVSFYVGTGNTTSFVIFGVLPPSVNDPSSRDAVILATVYASRSQDKWTYVSAKTGNWAAGARFFYLAEAVGVSVDRPQYINCHPDSHIDGSKANQLVSCNFSRPQDCGWFPERLASDIDWVIQADGAALPSHTWQPSKSSSGTGSYMYAQNTLPAVKKAHLVSMRMSPTPDVGRCFTFWYNMWHPNSGELNLLQRVDNISTSLLWTRSGPQGMAWQQGQVQLHCDEPQQLVFEAVLKPYVPGVIAIDQFKLKDGPCDPGNVCTFDSGSCGWQLHNWEITKGSSAILPAADHTTWAPPGAFALVMPPSGRMVSPQNWYDATQQRCLRFWFLAAGSATETLNITRVVDQVQQESLWFHRADYTTTKSWQSAAVNLTVSQGNTITVFEGMTSGSPGTAVAIDDISLGNEACPKPGSCSFEEDMCNWHNNKGFSHAQWYRHRGRTILSPGGPERDHTKDTSDGYYLLLDSQDQSDILIGSLQSEALALGPVVCFQLYYHMKNGTNALLNVTFNDASGVPYDQRTTVYATGPAEWTWLSVERDNLPRVFSVVITANAGKFAGDVAIDDIDMRPGKCEGAPDTTTASQSMTTTAVPQEPSTMRNTEASVTGTDTFIFLLVYSRRHANLKRLLM